MIIDVQKGKIRGKTAVKFQKNPFRERDLSNNLTFV